METNNEIYGTISDHVFHITALPSERKGVVFDPSINKSSDELFLASTTISDSGKPEDNCGIVISYTLKVTFYISALGGYIEAELPFQLINQRLGMYRV